MRLVLGLWLCLLCVACAKGPDSQWVKGETGRVVRVMDGDTFALNTGQVVRLASVEAPSFAYRGRKAMPYAEAAKKTLEALTLGRDVQLYYPGMTRDRYDRAIAQVYVLPEAGKKFWLNSRLAENGSVWVRLYPDTASGSETLWDAERSARKSGKGVWRESPPIYSPEDKLPEYGFVITKGKVSMIKPEQGQCYFQLSGYDFKVKVPASANNDCPVSMDDSVEARGWLSKNELRISYRANIRPQPDF